MHTNPTYSSLVAVGDSFTEGMSDLLPDGTYRGWADLLAARMAARTPGFRYASNLAVRGGLAGQATDADPRRPPVCPETWELLAKSWSAVRRVVTPRFT
ncbi:hypothetical protein SFUMM280S_07903 [Streptomyces fumanus]